VKKRILAYAFTPGEPPTELQLWDVGPNATDYGVHLWTARSAREVLDVYAARGNPLQIDVEHNNADADVEGDEPQGGYARLELRGGAPWLVFDWSAYAVDQIATKQRLFLSPEYDVDKTTHEIVRLVRVSLVADPGTHHARMLATAALRRVRAGGTTMNLALILAALRAALSADDPEVAKAQITNLIGEIEKAAGGGDAGAGDAGGATSAAAAQDPNACAAAADAGGAPGASDDDKKKEQMRAAAARAAAGPGASPEVIAIAARLATIETDNKALRAELAAANEQRASAERVEAAGERIPTSLRAFARSLNKTQFETFLKDLPGGAVGAGGNAGGERASSSGAGGVRAAARPATNRTEAPAGELPKEDQRAMARIFGNENRSEDSVEELPNGRIRTTHITRPKAAANGG
jgi:hypothetical protein